MTQDQSAEREALEWLHSVRDQYGGMGLLWCKHTDGWTWAVSDDAADYGFGSTPLEAIQDARRRFPKLGSHGNGKQAESK